MLMCEVVTETLIQVVILGSMFSTACGFIAGWYLLRDGAGDEDGE